LASSLCVCLRISKFTKIFFSLKLTRVRTFNFDLVILFDFYCALFILTVALITTRVLLFSNEYISNEKFFSRFHLILIRFVLSILLLILRPNIISALIGWDGLGVSSFVLVIYYSRIKSFNAGFITALTNRLGDGLLIWAVVMLFPLGDLRIFWYSSFWENKITAICLILGCFTKRAQVPFCAWLPAAIAAPTPVSSLVHSSTLVTAGVYLLIRHGNWAFRINNFLIFRFVGGLTTLIARASAFFERDIKKIVALSTLSQLGVIVVALGVGNWNIAFFHLIAHAFFKALLFISTGNLIHSRGDYQALKISGALGKSLPVSYAANMICRLRLCGLPFISAFFSKEPVIEISNESRIGGLIYLILFLGILITVAYRVRLTVLTGVSRFQGVKALSIEENLNYTSQGMILLFPGAVFGGTVARKWFFKNPRIFHNRGEIKLSATGLLVLGVIIGITLVNIKRTSNKYLTQFFRIWSLPWIRAPILLEKGVTLSAGSKRRENSWLWSLIIFNFFYDKSLFNLINFPNWNLSKFIKFRRLLGLGIYFW